MDFLINMNRHLRIGLLLTGFFVFFLLGGLISGWFFFVQFAFLVLLIYTNVKYDQKIRRALDISIEETLKANGFRADDFYLSDDYLSGLAINQESNEIAIMNRINSNTKFEFNTIPFQHILESSIIENKQAVTKSSKGSVIAGALVGSAVAGSTGALIGGLNSTKITSDKVSLVTLSIVVDDLKNPFYEINFLNSHEAFDKDTAIYKKVKQDINKWHRMISVILKRNELNSNS